MEQEDEWKRLGRLIEGDEDDAIARAIIGAAKPVRTPRRVVFRSLGTGSIHPRMPAGVPRESLKNEIRLGKIYVRRKRITKVPISLVLRSVSSSASSYRRGLAASHQAYIERMDANPPDDTKSHDVVTVVSNISQDPKERVSYWLSLERHETRGQPAHGRQKPLRGKTMQIRVISEVPWGLDDRAYHRIAMRLVKWVEGLTPWEQRRQGYNLPCSVAIHAPPGVELTGPGAGQEARNLHLHMIFHDRAFRRGDEGLWFARHKVRALSKRGLVTDLRKSVCDIVNSVAAKHKLGWKYQPGSYRDQGVPLEGLPRIPMAQMFGSSMPSPVRKVRDALLVGEDEQVAEHRKQSKIAKQKHVAELKATSVEHAKVVRLNRDYRAVERAWDSFARLGFTVEVKAPANDNVSREEFDDILGTALAGAPSLPTPPTRRQIAKCRSLGAKLGIWMPHNWDRDIGTAGLVGRLLEEQEDRERNARTSDPAKTDYFGSQSQDDQPSNTESTPVSSHFLANRLSLLDELKQLEWQSEKEAFERTFAKLQRQLSDSRRECETLSLSAKKAQLLAKAIEALLTTPPSRDGTLRLPPSLVDEIRKLPGTSRSEIVEALTRIDSKRRDVGAAPEPFLLRHDPTAPTKLPDAISAVPLHVLVKCSEMTRARMRTINDDALRTGQVTEHARQEYDQLSHGLNLLSSLYREKFAIANLNTPPARRHVDRGFER